MVDKFNFSKFHKLNKKKNGATGFYGGKLVRIFSKKDLDSIKEKLDFLNTIDNLIESRIIYQDEGLLIIEHPIIKNITYPTEWTYAQKIDAALTVIKIQEKLLTKNLSLSLMDPHAFNITFDKAKPIYLDFGSIRKKGIMNPRWWIWRAFISSKSYVGWGKTLKIAKLKIFFLFFMMLILPPPLFLKLFEKWLIKRRKKFKKTPWTTYPVKDLEKKKNLKIVKNFTSLLIRYSPKKIIDIGGGRGHFSIFALKYRVREAVVIDIDEFSLNILRREIGKKNYPIWIVNADLMKYPYDLSCYGDYPPLHKRINAEFVICFALIHHLCTSGGYSFEDFAKRIEKFCQKILVVEFVPFSEIQRTKSWYTQRNFIKVMKKYFPGKIEIFESSPKPRKLIKFEK